MKKIALIICLFCIALMQAFAYSYTDKNGVTWGFSISNSNATITSASGFGEKVTIPGKVYDSGNGYTVTALRNNLFSNNTTITEVILPSSVVTIESYCFSGCTNLLTINLSACTSIGNDAFANCTKLGNVTLSNQLKTLGTRAFQSCNSMTSISIPSCGEIQSWAFEWCKGLEKVEIGNGVKTIAYRAFSECTALKDVTILGGDTLYVGGQAFRACVALEKVTMPTTPYTIGASAFSGCNSLKSINLSTCISLSEGSEFENCSNLKTIGGLESCTSIGGYTFRNCSSLESVGDLPVCTVILDEAFANCSSLKSVGNLPACINISNNVFYNCSSLKSVGDLSSLINIKNNVLSGCYLEKLVLAGDNVVTLEAVLATPTTVFVPQKLLAAYKEANSWKDMTERILPIGVTTERNVNVSAQENTSNLAYKIGEDNLEYIMSLTLSGTINSYDFIVLRNKMPNLHHLDMTNVSIVANAANYYENYHTSNNTLGQCSFVGMNKLLTVKLPKTIKEIESDAFNGCNNMESVEFQEGIETIGQGAFYKCGNLRSAEMKSGLVTIGRDAFSNCSRLKNVVIPEGVQTIGDGAFRYCSSLDYIDVPKGVKAISGSSFYECSNLKKVNIDTGCEYIGGFSFYKCSNLEKVVIAEGVKNIDSYAFRFCGKLTSVQLPTTLISIGSYAFEGTNLLSLTLPSNLTTIGAYAFQNNSSLTEVRIPAMVSSIGNYAFSGCSSLKDVYVYVLEPQSIAQNTFSTYQTSTLHVPTTSYYSYYYNTQWSQFANVQEFSAPYFRFFFDTDYTLDDVQGVIDTETESECNINAGASLIVNTQQENQYIGTIHIKNDGTKSGSLIANGNMSAQQVNFEMAINKTTWYFLCVPYRIKLEDVEAPGNYVFRYYDGAERAANGKGGWKNLPTGTQYLLPGVGYIFQCDQAGTLVLKATEENIDFSGNDKSLNMVAYQASGIQNASWNYMGNPFTSYYDIDDMGYESPITVWNGRGYDAVRPGDDDYHLRPLQAFFVQKPENVDALAFNASSRETYLTAQSHSAAKKARRMMLDEKVDRFIVNLKLSDGTDADKTRVVYNEGRSMTYEMECDAAKFMTAGIPQLYTLDQDNVHYSINERPLGQVDLGYDVSKKGVYTIAATRMDRPVLLKDHELGVTFDLSNGEYSFTSDAGTNEKRFTLILCNETVGIAQMSEQTGVKANVVDGGIVFAGIDGNTQVCVYTLSGTMVANGIGNGFFALPNGSYVVKVNGLSTKVLVQ